MEDPELKKNCNTNRGKIARVNNIENLLKEILNLNQRVVDNSSGNISSNVHQYIGYIDDIEKLPIPNERPIYLNKDNYTYDISNIL